MLERISPVGARLAVGRKVGVARILRVQSRGRQHGSFVKGWGPAIRSSHRHPIHGIQLGRILSVLGGRHSANEMDDKIMREPRKQIVPKDCREGTLLTPNPSTHQG